MFKHSSIMTAFVSASFPVTIKRSHFCGVWSPRFLSRNSTSHHPTRQRCHVPSYICMQESTAREQALPVAVDEILDEYLKTGMNIYIADGETDMLIPLLDAIQTRIEVDALIDMAIVGGTPTVINEIEQRKLPSDLAVNFKRGIDLFIAVVTKVDADCNAALDSCDFEADRYAGQIAEKVVLLIREDDFKLSERGLPSFPVKLAPFLPDVAVKGLCSSAMFTAGIRGASLRPESCIADVSIAALAKARFLEDELRRLACVCAVGLLPASKKTTVVVAADNLSPFDVTSPIHTMSSVSDENRKKKLNDEERMRLSEQLSEWRIISGEQEALMREFVFTSADRADTFVRYTHFVSNSIWHHPEIRQAYTRVRICLTTYDAGGISELDSMLALELSRIYESVTNVSGAQ